MEPLLIILLAALATAVPFALGQRYGAVPLVSPMHLLSYFCLFGFLIKAVAYAIWPDLSFYRSYVSTPWADLRGAFYLGSFILLYCLGYRLACRSQCRADSVVVARTVSAGLTRRSVLFSASVLVAGLTFLAIIQARGLGTGDLLAGLNSAKQIRVNADGVGSTLAGIKTFFVVPKFAFVLLVAHAIATRSRCSAALATVLGVLLVGVAIISGDRFELVELVIYALSTFVILGGRLSLRTGLRLGLGVAFLGFAAVYMTSLRLDVQPGRGAMAMAVQVIGSTYFLDFNTAVMVTDLVPPDAYLWGSSYTWWSFGWVPRALWEAKPAIDLGVFLKRDIVGLHTGGAFNVTGPGEAFINFGWAGLLVGLVLGWVYRKGEAWCLSAMAGMRYAAFLLYPMLFYPFVQASLQSSFSAFVVGAAAQLVLIWAMIGVFMARYSLWLPPNPQERSRLYVA